MSIKIKKDGQVREFILPATNIQVLDMADKFKKKDLENVIKEISDTEHIYVGEVDETKDGIWIDDGDILDNAENNGVVERIKEYVDGEIKDYSNPNLLVNGDFQVWSKGESFDNSVSYCADKWLRSPNKSTGIISKTTLNGKPALLYTANETQNMEINLEQNVDGLQRFRGKKMTLSWETNVSIDMTYSILVYAYIGDTGTIKTFCNKAIQYTSGSPEKHVETFEIPSDLDERATLLRVRVLRNPSVVPHQITITDVKLEIGEKATPFVSEKYSEALLNCNDGIIGSNPNLLINGGFDVWQRGTRFDRTNITGKFYTADRFCAYRSGFAQGLKVEKKGGNENEVVIRATNNFDKASAFSYTFDEKEVIALRGKTLTFSFKYRTGSLITNTIAIRAFYSNNSVFSPGQASTGVLGDKLYNPSTSTQTAKLTFTVPMTAKGLIVDMRIFIPSAESESYVCTKEWKLEVGTLATPFSSKPYSQELADCQRYCQAQQLLGLPFRYGTNFISASISTPVTLRTAPTLIGDIDNWTIYNNNAVVQTGFTSATLSSMCGGAVNIQFNKANHGLKVTDGIYFTTSNVILDAEIY